MRNPLFPVALIIGSMMPTAILANLYCESPDGSAIVSVAIGNLPVMEIYGADLTAGNSVWSTRDGSIGDISGFADDDGSLRFDFADADINTIIARLRLFLIIEADDYVLAGALQIVDVGAYPVICAEP